MSFLILGGGGHLGGERKGESSEEGRSGLRTKARKYTPTPPLIPLHKKVNFCRLPLHGDTSSISLTLVESPNCCPSNRVHSLYSVLVLFFVA